MTLKLDKTIICDNFANANFQCNECGDDLAYCDCLWDADVYDVDVFCDACDRTHYNINVDDLLKYEYEHEYNDSGIEDYYTTETVADRYSYYNKCRHYNHGIEFPDGVNVFASSSWDRKAHDIAPDFGLYLDRSWKATCLAYFIDWPDYGIPTRPEVAAYTIIDAYLKAERGLWVEVGCIGGHGRTGTALACMAVLSGLAPDKAIRYVRENYCDQAIEAHSQEWFIEWFAAFVNGGIAPSRETYDSFEKKTIIHPEIVFDVPLEWRDFDPFQNPKGAPPVDDMFIEQEEYVAVTKKGDDGKSVTEYVYPDSKDWDWDDVIHKAEEQEVEITESDSTDYDYDLEDWDDDSDLSVQLIKANTDKGTK